MDKKILNKRNHWSVIGIAVTGTIITIIVMLFSLHMVQAQVGEKLGLEIDKTLEGSEVVQVGQVLEFTIRIRNTGNLSVTHMVVEDVFDASVVEPASVGQFAETDDPPPADPPATVDGNTITWENAVAHLPAQELGPGEEMILKVYLRAIHPSEELTTVNHAAIKEAIARGGKKESDVGESDYNNDVGGNNAPVTKKVTTEGPIYAGTLVTYTIQVDNKGLSPIDSIPIRDNYNPAMLEFIRAVPPASSSDKAMGVLEWSDILAITGRDQLDPGERIEITTVYRALQAVDNTTNEVEVNGASDKYGNKLTPRQAQAPIRIVQAPTDTATATSTPIAPTATATLSATIAATAILPTTPTAITTTIPTATATVEQPTPTFTIVVVTFVPTSTPLTQREQSNDDDDDDDDKPTATTTKTATPFQTNTTTAIATIATETATSMPTTATPEQLVVVTTTLETIPTMTVPIPSELPNTGAGDTFPIWILIVACILIVSGTGLVWWSKGGKRIS